MYDSYIEEQRALAEEAYQNGAVGSGIIFGIASGGALATEFGAAILGVQKVASNIAASYRALKQAPNSADELFPILPSLGADANKLRNTLAKLGNQAAGQTGKKAATALQKMAQKAGLTVASGGKHLRVFDDAGNLVTTIPHSPHAKGTIKGIAEAIMEATGF